VATSAALQGLARAHQVTLNTVIQAAWALVLGHLSERDDIVFGAAFSGRPADLPGVETLVGPCVNNLPVRVRLDLKQPASAALRDLHERSLEIGQHQYASLADIQEWAGIPWKLRIFDSLVVFQNYLVGEGVRRWESVLVEPLIAPEATNYPLTLTVTPGAETSLKLLAPANRFASASLTMMLQGLATVLEGLAEKPDALLFEIQSRLPAETRGLAVAALATAGRQRQASHVAPGNEMERLVAEVWQELFQVDEVSVLDNFFDLGGHSILLVQAHVRIRERTKSALSIVALLQYPTVRSLARYLSDGGTANPTLGAVTDRARLQREAVARQRSLQGKR
jgi:non-ribosomal peptide synthetase component F